MCESKPSPSAAPPQIDLQGKQCSARFFPRREAAPAPAAMGLHGYTLQFLIAVIKKLDRKIGPRA
jgi:hypothetical protein